ncbi:MAG: type II toxin-antitoxin system RelE/ParE family toxin [Alcanivoracaceae bacterium]
MGSGFTHYVLSGEADQDVSDIFDYSVQMFGVAQAAEYLLSLDACFQSLIVNPDLGRERNEIRLGLRSVPVGSHVVFYRIDESFLRIVRVLHGSRDLPRHFPEAPEGA